MNILTENFQNNANNWSIFKDNYGSFKIKKNKAIFEYYKDDYLHWVTLSAHIPYPSYMITSEIQCIFRSINSSYGLVFDAENLNDLLAYQVYPGSGFFQICRNQNGNWSRLNVNYLQMHHKPTIQHKLQVHYLLAGEDVAIVQCYLDSILTNQIMYEIPTNKFFRGFGFIVSQSKNIIKNINFQTLDSVTTYVAIHASSSNC